MLWFWKDTYDHILLATRLLAEVLEMTRKELFGKSADIRGLALELDFMEKVRRLPT